MEKLPLYYEDNNFIYVHGGINKGVSMEKQSKETLLWAREEFYYDTRKYKKTVIFGHTPTAFLNGKNDPVWINGCIDIDTGCVFGGKLTALLIDNDKIIRYYQISKGDDTVTENSINENNIFWVCAQAIYGNRNFMKATEDSIDYLLSGLSNDRYLISDKHEVKINDTENLYVVYSPSEEAKRNNRIKKLEEKYGINEAKPTFISSDNKLILYSRCLLIKKDDDGNYCDVTDDDLLKVSVNFPE